MAPNRPDYHLDLKSLPPLIPPQTASNTSTATSSPVDPTQQALHRFGVGDTSSNTSQGVGSRIGTGSPSHDYGSRFYPSRRTRELASEGGPTRSIWGGPPVASGLSTPLRETIPESPGDDGADTFPDFATAVNEGTMPLRSASLRRSRAGTMPSKTATGATLSSRPTPSTSPFQSNSSGLGGLGRSNSAASASNSALLSRIRAGSLPHRSSLLPSSSTSSSPFGSNLFSSSYKPPRDRASTHSGVSKEPGSPSQSGLWETNFADTDIKTLDYLGLADRPSQNRQNRADSVDAFGIPLEQQAIYPLLANMNNMNRTANRFRSYSVNAKEKYAADEEGDVDYGGYYSGTMTPSQEHLFASMQQMQADILEHNAQVQAFANRASSSRPRARTAGNLDSPSLQPWRSNPSSRYAVLGEDLSSQLSMGEYAGLADTMASMNLHNGYQTDLSASEEATRSLWLGGIPKSTTESSLRVIFESFGNIASTKVLPEKNCAFINFENVDSAVRAKYTLSSQEIFPGAGPVRIGYAKSRSSENANVSSIANNGSASPDPFTSIKSANIPPQATSGTRQTSGQSEAAPSINAPSLSENQAVILEIVREFGARPEDQQSISAVLQQALANDEYYDDIPAIPEPSHSRVYDAPRLRDIRKRIDTNSCSPAEVEEIAIAMLPEIAELSSDYIGNTVVQKLFETCSETVKEAMLEHISPRLAEIGVHKNGTWAAQKIIDLAQTPAQMSMIEESLRRYSVAAFLDQYGNYVMQCCLKFGQPYNGFIFEVMLNRLWDLAQGRFGARAMRACLESHHATKDQQRMAAAVIALHSVQLATNANGALLLTWFLDTCSFPNRRKVLAPRLIPHLIYLCTHKVAYLTVVKLINQKNEPEARDMLTQALFFSDDNHVLAEVLKDQACGAQFVFKVITTPVVVDSIGPSVNEVVRKVLIRINAQASQGYKRLMDEVGMLTRGNASGREPVTGLSTPAKRDGSNFQSTSKASNGHASANPMGRTTPGMIPMPNGFNGTGYATGNYAIMNSGNGMAMTPMYAGPIAMNANGQGSEMQYQAGGYANGRATAGGAYNSFGTAVGGYNNPGVEPFRGAMGPRIDMSMGSAGYGMPMNNGRNGTWGQWSNPYAMHPGQQQQTQAGESPRNRSHHR